ncbi:OLC1v1009387C1 [Oldenlandia corymbosa var. corymbosa]|nr:OLC1v1009387C1 [Oldenlandia corymbosa var. corymbosa]
MKNMHHHHSSSESKPDLNDPELQIFFRVDDLKLGGKLPIYFPIKDLSSAPPLLSREEADSIPFSSAHLPKLLERFSISDGSPQAKAMETTLNHCEFEPMKGESKFCATSLESLLDSTRSVFGSKSEFKVATTIHLNKNSTSLLQNYTIVENPIEIPAPRIVGCHPLPYPYSVFYCHSQESDNKLFKVSLMGENGWRVEALGICHMDTSQWDSDHVAFLVLNTQPGKSPVCHFFPADNLVWFPSQYETM